MSVALPPSWHHVLDQRTLDAFAKASSQVEKARISGEIIYPPPASVLNAFLCTPATHVRVVILGQDPYHGAGQAHGLSFSVPQGVKFPPSLRNIMKERHSDIGCEIPQSGDLTPWAKRGLLLLNTVLTVENGRPGSHQHLGWETFTDGVIRYLSAKEQPLAFILWGSHAQKKKSLIDPRNHLILETAHPSPLSAYRGFFGSRPFSRINSFLQEQGEPPFDWSLPSG